MYKEFEHPKMVFDNEVVRTHFDTLERVPRAYKLSIIDQDIKESLKWLRSNAPHKVLTEETTKARYYPSYWDNGIDKTYEIVMNNMRALGNGSEC